MDAKLTQTEATAKRNPRPRWLLSVEKVKVRLLPEEATGAGSM